MEPFPALIITAFWQMLSDLNITALSFSNLYFVEHFKIPGNNNQGSVTALVLHKVPSRDSDCHIWLLYESLFQFYVSFLLSWNTKPWTQGSHVNHPSTDQIQTRFMSTSLSLHEALEASQTGGQDLIFCGPWGWKWQEAAEYNVVQPFLSRAQLHAPFIDHDTLHF